MSQSGENRYSKMKMRHIVSPHCTLVHIFVFFFCVTTGIGIYLWIFTCRYNLEEGSSLYSREAGTWIGTISELSFDSLKKWRVCGVKCLRTYLGFVFLLISLILPHGLAKTLKLTVLSFDLALSCFRKDFTLWPIFPSIVLVKVFLKF